MEFTTLGSLPVGEAETFLLYGGSGTGKTFSVGSLAPEALFINIGAGLSTLQSPLYKSRFPKVGGLYVVTLVEENSDISLPTLMDAVSDTIDKAVPALEGKITAVILDDATALRTAALAKGLVTMSKTGKSQTLANAKTLGTVIPAVQDYGAEMQIIEQFVSYYTKWFKAKNLHFVMTAHEPNTFRKGDKIGDIPVLIKTTPSFTGVDKNPDYIAGHFDNVWHTKVVGAGDRRLYRTEIEGSETLLAKTRWGGVFKPMEENLNIAAAIQRIQTTKR